MTPIQSLEMGNEDSWFLATFFFPYFLCFSIFLLNFSFAILCFGVWMAIVYYVFCACVRCWWSWLVFLIRSRRSVLHLVVNQFSSVPKTKTKREGSSAHVNNTSTETKLSETPTASWRKTARPSVATDGSGITCRKPAFFGLVSFSVFAFAIVYKNTCELPFRAM